MRYFMGWTWRQLRGDDGNASMHGVAGGGLPVRHWAQMMRNACLSERLKWIAGHTADGRPGPYRPF